MPQVLSPILLYIGCAVGAIGVILSLPRARFSLFPIGSLIAAAGVGVVWIGLGATYPDKIPNYHYYIFSAIALGASLRVITHPRPVYAALYFILTILASAGLYLILSAEFMSFALIIVYAGAILITYIFVIMLATESPSEEQPDVLNEYDRVSREPVMATLAGFILLAALSSMLASGSAGLRFDPAKASGDRGLEVMTKKVERILRDAGQLGNKETILVENGKLAMDVKARTIKIVQPSGEVRTLTSGEWPEALRLSNTEGVAHALIVEHPGSIEIAGVILLLAMLGAVVLARKKVDMDEQAKAQAAAREKSSEAGDELGIEGRYSPPGVGEGGSPS